MLEIRNITKVYRSKTGEKVVALNNVSVSFPETGMVFILGKSGSGKSTLLNVIGGLDGYDSGEFVIMGKSSKDFAGSDFDAYRNTFIGFIFQEYNILDDFSVGANIGLALELQGKKATNEAINQILAQGDLLNYAIRKPNELSGGQKQRIAIARALVKDPQIIMADEPTGALDSNTGKQIFDTLKELSHRKLVLIVSHDRDFAERYADRIIELSDGNIVSDVTKHEQSGRVLNEGIEEVSEKILRIKPGYRLTAKDLDMINSYLVKSESGVVLSGDARVNEELRSAAGLTESGGTAVFENTNAAQDVPLQTYDGSKTHFIRSRLPMKNAVKMGASGLKHKKFRLFMTILLSLVAFSMFGLADTMAAYKKAETATRSILDSNIDNASFALSLKATTYDVYNGKERTWTSYQQAAMNDRDIETLSEKTGVSFIPVFNGSDSRGSIPLTRFMKDYDGKITAYQARLSGFVAMTPEQLANADLTVSGRLPENADEIALPKFIYDQFKQYGFENSARSERITASQMTMEGTGATSILGKHISIGGGGISKSDGTDFEYVIVGIVETHFDSQRYKKFLSEENQDSDSQLADLLLQMELNDTLSYGFHTLGFVTKSAVGAMSENARSYINRREIGIYTNNVQLLWDSDANASDFQTNFGRVADFAEINGFPTFRPDGSPVTALGEKEYLVSRDVFLSLVSQSAKNGKPVYAKTAEKYAALFSDAARAWAAGQASSYGERSDAASCYRYAEENYEANKTDLNASGINSVEDYARWLRGGNGNADLDDMIRANRLALLASYAADLGIDAPYEKALESLESDLNTIQPDNAESTLSLDDLRPRLASYYAAVDVYQNDVWQDVALQNRFAAGMDWGSMTDEEKKACVYSGLSFSLAYEQSDRKIGTYSPMEIFRLSMAAFGKLTGNPDFLQIPQIRRAEYDWERGGDLMIKGTYEGYTLAGYFSTEGVSDDNYYDLLVCDAIKADVLANSPNTQRTVVAEHEPGIWAFAIAPMPTDRSVIQKMVNLSYEKDSDLLFSLRNQVMNTLESFNSFIEIAAKVFLYVGIGFAVFSALLLMNFISVSISYKRHEIGILRAVGARSSDVFKIFFSESFIIALINYFFSVIVTIISVSSINRSFRGQGLNVTLLHFGIRQLLLMFLISLGVAAIASFLPVWNIARRRPIDAIRNR